MSGRFSVGMAAGAFALAAVFAAPAALAIGSEPAKPVKTCKKGMIFDKNKKVCVPQASGLMLDADVADYAHALAREGRPEEALAVLALAADQGRADILNIRGYATRKLGRVDEGIGYYKQALAADPENVLVREYLGEAYITKGRLDEARALLKEIEARCGTGCEAYEDLAEAIGKAG